MNGVDQKSAIFWELPFYTDASLEVVNVMIRVHTCNVDFVKYVITRQKVVIVTKFY